MVMCQRPRSCVAHKCTCVIYGTGTANSPFSTPGISITTKPISIKIKYFMPLYTQPYIPNLKKIGLVVHEIHVPKNIPIFFTIFSSLYHFTKVTLNQPKNPPSH